MKYLGILLLMALSACGTAPTPQQTGGGDALEATAINGGGGGVGGGGGIAPVIVDPTPTTLPGPMDSVVIFKSAVGNSIALNGKTDVPINTSIVIRFSIPQDPSLIRTELTYVPFMAPFPRSSVSRDLSCIWSDNYKTDTCLPNVTRLDYNTTYRLNVYKNSLLRATASFTTESMSVYSAP